MFILAGLGNPGIKYRHTRHNAGFDVIDVLADRYNIPVRKSERNALTGQGVIEGEKVLLVKPQTFMNNSGESLGPLCSFYKVDPATQLIVFSDDVTLDAGNLRIRKKCSAGGHNGLKSIIAHCGGEDFLRIRVGVGKLPTHGDMIAHVLGKLPKDERPYLEEAMDRACDAAEMIIRGDLDGAMNQFNTKVR